MYLLLFSSSKGKLNKSLPKSLNNLEIQPSMSMRDKTFDHVYFLREVHYNSSFKDLEQGLARLKVAIEQRDEVTKGLVKQHFAKFVNAKNTIDLFYREMRQKNLISTVSYGIAPYAKALESNITKSLFILCILFNTIMATFVLDLEGNAFKLYGPVLGRRFNGVKIRTALSILEGWKFFFNLPSSLSDQIRKGKYENAVRDYKKGKYLMFSSFSPDDNAAKEAASKPKDSATLLPKHHRVVFEKVWFEVERIVKTLHEELFAKLADPAQPLELQEKHIGYLIELDCDRDPVWCFLESQYTCLIDNVVGAYKNYAEKLEGIRVADKKGSMSWLTSHDSFIDGEEPERKPTMVPLKDSSESCPHTNLLSLSDIKKGLACVTSRNFEVFFSKYHIVCVCVFTRTSLFLTISFIFVREQH